jgi:hypothetical protein
LITSNQSGQTVGNDWDALGKQLRLVYTAPAPRPRPTGSRSSSRPGAAGIRRSSLLWRSAWEEFIPFLDYDAPDPLDHLFH